MATKVSCAPFDRARSVSLDSHLSGVGERRGNRMGRPDAQASGIRAGLCGTCDDESFACAFPNPEGRAHESRLFDPLSD